MSERRGPPPLAPPFADLPGDFVEVYRATAPFTMTSIERMYALYEACGYIARAGIPGDVVECGVWRGGSSMLAALTLRDMDPRPLWMYDTFEGMPPPSEVDRMWSGEPAAAALAATPREAGANNEWAYATIDDARTNMDRTAYTAPVEYVAGKVEDTIPGRAPGVIALLRLDTDWYESTRHELEHLYPRLSPGGVLIIDDYGWWEGARKAVDEFFADRPILLNRIDMTGRIAVKPQ